MMDAVICYKTEDGKVFQTEKEARIHEAEYNFKKELYELGSTYDYDTVECILDDWKYIDEIITKYKKRNRRGGINMFRKLALLLLKSNGCHGDSSGGCHDGVCD